MSQFAVHPDALRAGSARLAPIRDSIAGMQIELQAHVGAGEGTSLSDAVDGLVGRWGQVLPLYGECAARLSDAVAGAGGAYTSTDERLASVAGPRGTGDGAGR